MIEKRRAKKSKVYFGKQMQEYIQQYIDSDNAEQKNQLYKKHIHKAFLKIATSLVYKYNIEKRIKNSNIMIHECVSNMTSKFNKYKPERGKAFSFFTVIARNFILINLDKTIKHNKLFKSFNSINDSGDQINLIDVCSQRDWEQYKQDKYSQIVLEHTMERLINYIQEQFIPLKTKKIYQQQIALAVVQLIKDIDFLQNFNKKAIMLYIIEMTGCNPYKINRVLKKISVEYFKIKQEVIQTELELLQYQY